jgi:multidrug efflux pump subunit AcrA (membrane-fusion protein)
VRSRALWWLLAIAAAIAFGWALVRWRNQPPEVRFVRVTREAISNSVPTNGKVEPIEWATARAERPGAVQKMLIQRGQNVAKDAPLVEIDSTDARADLAAAQAKIAQIHAELDVIERGGRATDLAEISSGLERARLELRTAQKDYDALVRLEAKQAATPVEVAAAKERVDRAQIQIHSLEERRGALVVTPDRTAAQARLKEAEAAAALAEQRIRTSVVRAPIDGTVYQFDLKPGAYLNAGDVVASIGRLDHVRVNVYVDEPDLGRVDKGLPAVITWDALPGRQWTGTVDRTPTQIVALGTRQVGEVVCLIQNPDRDLLPGTNVNVDIRVQSVENALTVPKEVVRKQGGKTGVFVLDGDHLVWKTVTLGIASTTRTQVDGLSEGDAVALSSDKPLRAGMPAKVASE